MRLRYGDWFHRPAGPEARSTSRSLRRSSPSPSEAGNGCCCGFPTSHHIGELPMWWQYTGNQEVPGITPPTTRFTIRPLCSGVEGSSTSLMIASS